MSHNHAQELAETADLSAAFRWAVALDAGYVVVELIAGIATGSLALLADAADELAHEFSIAHVTPQIEVRDKDQCRLAPVDVV